MSCALFLNVELYMMYILYMYKCNAYRNAHTHCQSHSMLGDELFLYFLSSWVLSTYGLVVVLQDDEFLSEQTAVSFFSMLLIS